MTGMPPRYPHPCTICNQWEPEYACLDTLHCVKPAQWDKWTALPDDSARNRVRPDEMPITMFDPVSRFSDAPAIEPTTEKKLCEWPHGCTHYAQIPKVPQEYDLCCICNNRVHKRMLRGLPESEWYTPSKKEPKHGS